MKTYAKDVERALMGKGKHRVLLFGKKTFHTSLTIKLDSCEVEQILFPDDRRMPRTLSEYTLVILDYSAFMAEGGGVLQKDQEIFEKMMLEALSSGTCFCFLHYDEVVPKDQRYGYGYGGMDEDDYHKCRHLQIGFRWSFNIRPFRYNSPILDAEIKRNEFKKYMDRWGASKSAFQPYGDGNFSDIISKFSDYTISFVVDFRRGKLIYVPCQRDFSRPDNLSECFSVLIDSLITYLTKSRTELPDWAAIPLFEEEKGLFQEKLKLNDKLIGCEGKLCIFYSAKQLLFQSEYGLEEALPKFLKDQCGINVKREETYKEDFWILNLKDERVAICEVKSYVKGFKKSGLFNLYNHRESYNLEENFPAVLFVNANLNAASWEQKDKPVDKQDYEEATNKHVLIVRIEDLLFAWQAIREGIFTPDKLMEIFKSEVGWLKFKKDKTWGILTSSIL